MKMFRLLASMVVLISIGIAGCGTSSPDFRAQLLQINVTPATTSAALGDKKQFTATGVYTTPPGSPTDTVTGPVDNASWSVSDTQAAAVDASGLVSTLLQGTVTVTASKDGVSGVATLTITAPELRRLVVSPATKTIALGASQTYTVQGVYSDGQTRDIVLATNPISWISSATTVATVAPTTGATTVASSGGAGQTTGTTTISACTPQCTTPTLKGDASLTVGNAVLTGVVQVTPAADTVAAGNSKPFQLIGRYGDGSTQPISNSSIDWTVSDASIAQPTAAAADNKVVVKGLKKGGPVDVIGTLKNTVDPSITQRSAKGSLTVVDAACTTPMTAPKYKTATAVDTLCLVCSVDNPDNVIDADPLNFAGLTSTIGLLTSGVTLTVSPNASPVTTYAPGAPAGFIIGRPAGQLLSAEVLSQFTVSTLLNGAVQESATSSAASTLPPLLRLTLLGMLGDSNTALISFPTTKPYDAISLTFGTGVASLLTTTQVFAACATATPPP